MNNETVHLAGGCFWGLQELLRKQKGVLHTDVGYCGGTNTNPRYEFHPGHAETVRVSYDPSVISYKELLLYFFSIHNPTTLNKQGNDTGSSYRSTIFIQNEEQKNIANEVINIVNDSGKWKDRVVTTLEPFHIFYLAEEEHQDYLQKHPYGYTCHQIYVDRY